MRLSVVILLILPIVAVALTEDQIQILQELSTPSGFERYYKKQISDKARRISKECIDHLSGLIYGLLKGQIWAFKMFDAGAKISSGLLRGHGAALGMFDECISIKSGPAFGLIRGKYCQGSLLLANLTNIDFDLGAILPFPISTRQARLLSFKESTVTLPWGVCFPDACSAQDIQIMHLSIFRFKEETCQTQKSQTTEFDSGDVIAITIFGVLLCLVLLSTTFEAVYFYYKKERLSDLMTSFSIITNARKIMQVNPENSKLSSLHGIRAFTLILIMGGMRYLMFIFAPLHNWLDLYRWVKDPDNGVILEMLICMDTFFVISGFLISYKYLEANGNAKRFSVVIYYLKRIIRLTPPLALIVLFNATLLRHIGSGPVWPKISHQWLIDNCRTYWWSTLLYVQNYVNPKLSDVCLLPTWQLSADMQLFILSPLILFPLKRWPKVTLCAVGVLFSCAMLVQFLIAWVYKIKAVLVMQMNLKDMENYFESFFFPTHTRAAPWLIGFILGYVVFNSNGKAIFKRGITSHLLAFLIWVISIALLIFVILVGRVYLEHDYDQASHSVLIGFIRPLWGIGVSWVIYACATNLGGPINLLLSSPPCVIMSKISYCTYLVYFTILFFFTFQTRIGIEFNHLDAIYRIFADISICALIGFVWSLFFELPFIAIFKYFLNTDKSDTTI